MWQVEWLEQFPKVTFQPNEKIIQIDESVKFNYYLIDGICARVFPTAEGKNIVLHYSQSGKMLGIHLQQFGEKSSVDFVARTTCQCYQIPMKMVQQYLKENNETCYSIMQEITAEYNEWTDLSIAHILGGGISSLCLAIKSLAFPQTDGTYLLHPMFTNVELSNYCGIHTVSVSRFMSRLAQEDILERTKDGVIIYDMERLSEYIKLGE